MVSNPSVQAALPMSIPQGYILGRQSAGNGPVEVLKLSSLGAQMGKLPAAAGGNQQQITFNGNAAEYLNGTGAFTTPSSGGGNALIDRTAGTPAVAHFSWANQGSATAADIVAGLGTTKIGLTMTTVNVSGDNHNQLVRSLPTAPYRIAALIQQPVISISGTSKSTAYLVAKNSVSGKYIGISAIPASGNTPVVGVDKYNSVTSYNSNAATVGVFPNGEFLVAIRDDNAGNLYWEYSVDGVNFVTIHTETVATFLTTYDQIGLDVNNNTGGSMVTTLRLWDENALTGRVYPSN